MDKLKNFNKFVKENNEEKLDNQVADIPEDDILTNMKDIPSELWSEEMVDAYTKYESMNGDLDNIVEETPEYDEESDDIEPGDRKQMVHNPSNDDKLKESSELQDYEVKDIFKEEENENEG